MPLPECVELGAGGGADLLAGEDGVAMARGERFDDLGEVRCLPGASRVARRSVSTRSSFRDPHVKHGGVAAMMSTGS